jgi:phosphate uptake regulator
MNLYISYIIYINNMNRRIIEQGKGAFTVTLPITWVREHSLKGGDEVTLTQLEQGLLIRTHAKLKSKSLTIDNQKLTKRISRVHMNAAYAGGYDEITLLKKIDSADLYQNMGFAIMQASDTYIVKDISGVTTTDIHDIFKRVFQMVLAFFTESYEDMFIHNLKNQNLLRERDAEINKFCNYLLRSLAKHEAQSALEGKILFTYAHALEQLADEIMRLWRCSSKESITKQTEQIALQIKDHLQAVFIAFYTTSDISKIYETKNKIRDDILLTMRTNASKKTKNSSTIPFETYLRMLKIVELATDVMPLTLMMRFEKNSMKL